MADGILSVVGFDFQRFYFPSSKNQNYHHEIHCCTKWFANARFDDDHPK